MSRDHLPPAARAAHSRMLDAFDALMHGAIRRAGEATEARLRAEGRTPAEAAQGARENVDGLLGWMQRERARLEAEAVTHMH